MADISPSIEFPMIPRIVNYGQRDMMHVYVIGDDDCVLVSANTCKAVGPSHHLVDNEILFGESESEGFNIAVDLFDRVLHVDTKLVATHLFEIRARYAQ